MKTRNILAGLALAVALAGCSDIRTEYSEKKTEEARVTEKYHKNAWTSFIPIRCGKVTIMSPVHHPEINRITFDGAVDFTLNNKDLYNRFETNDSLEVSYQEVYKATYKDINRDGINEFAGRVLDSYEFIDACPITDNSTKLQEEKK